MQILMANTLGSYSSVATVENWRSAFADAFYDLSEGVVYICLNVFYDILTVFFSFNYALFIEVYICNKSMTEIKISLFIYLMH